MNVEAFVPIFLGVIASQVLPVEALSIVEEFAMVLVFALITWVIFKGITTAYNKKIRA